jgi:soluble lytic murein transglycosylase-like protein
MAWRPPVRVERYAPLVDKWCSKLGVSQALVKAVIQWESGGDPGATRFEPLYYQNLIEPKPYWQNMMQQRGWTKEDVASSYGLMQIMYPTAQSLGCGDPKTLFDADQNIRFGVAYIAGLKRRYGDNEELVLAHYNGGAKGVQMLLAGKTTRATTYAKKVHSLADRYREYHRAMQKAGAPA